MCGIVGAVSTRNIVPVLVQGLQRLEYRGYDSCGVAVNADTAQLGQAAGLQRARSTARVSELIAQVGDASGGACGLDSSGLFLPDGDFGGNALPLHWVICVCFDAKPSGGGDDLLHDDRLALLCGISELFGEGSRMAGGVELYFHP